VLHTLDLFGGGGLDLSLVLLDWGGKLFEVESCDVAGTRVPEGVVAKERESDVDGWLLWTS
jgi:hypothetical protein